MRILIATQHRNIIGGIEKYLQTLMPSLSARGHEIALVCENHCHSGLERIDAEELHLPAWSIAESGADQALSSVAAWKPDVVYSQGIENTRFQDALLDSYPAVLYAHNYVGTCATGQKSHLFPAAGACSRQFGAACLLLHYPRRCGGLNPATMFRMFTQCGKQNAQLPKYKSVLVASHHMRVEFQRHGVSPERIGLLPLPNPQVVPAELPIRETPRNRILFLGRLTRLKGVGHLLRAVPLAAQKLGYPLSLTIAGDGPEMTALRSLAQQVDVQAKFIGWVDDSHRAELARRSDLLAVPSLWPEPFGLVGIEAGAFGIPAVAYKVGGVSDWLIPGRSGELAPANPPTPEGLAEAIVRIFADQRHYFDLCRGSWEVARSFSLEAHLANLEGILSNAQRHSAASLISEVGRVHV